MKIKRNINSVEVEIELTQNELMEAYWEEQYNCDVSDINMAFEDMDEAEINETYGVSWSEIEPLIPEMVHRYRKYMDNDDSWGYNREAAITYVLSEHRTME